MKKVISILMVLVLITGLITGCTNGNLSNQSTETVQSQGSNSENSQSPVGVNSGNAPVEIVCAQSADIVTLDPHDANDFATSNVTRQIYGSLVRANADMEYVGDLAESWEVLSPTEWKFNLRKESNGTMAPTSRQKM